MAKKYFELKSVESPKYSRTGYTTMVRLLKKNGQRGQSLDDFISHTVGTEKTREWSAKIEQDNMRRWAPARD